MSLNRVDVLAQYEWPWRSRSRSFAWKSVAGLGAIYSGTAELGLGHGPFGELGSGRQGAGEVQWRHGRGL